MITETSGFTHRLTSSGPSWFTSDRALTESDASEESAPERPIEFALDTRV